MRRSSDPPRRIPRLPAAQRSLSPPLSARAQWITRP
jgi:hypothetical protein